MPLQPKIAGRFLFCFNVHAACSTTAAYQPGDFLLFGSESRGLPPGLLQRHAERPFGIPMPAGKVRSLNLATAVGIALYEAWQQFGKV